MQRSSNAVELCCIFSRTLAIIFAAGGCVRKPIAIAICLAAIPIMKTEDVVVDSKNTSKYSFCCFTKHF